MVNGMLQCVEAAATSTGAATGAPTSSAGSSGTSTGVPMLGGTTGSAPTGVPMLGGTPTGTAMPTGTSAGGAGSSTGNPGASGGTSVGTGGGGTVVPGNAGSGTVSTAGSGTVGTGGTGTTTGTPTGLGSIVVSADALRRENTVVQFDLPGSEGKSLMLDDGAGGQIPAQVHPLTGRVSFVLPLLEAGAQATYQIQELAAPPTDTITAGVEGEHLYVKTGPTTIFRWTLVEDNFRGAASRDVRAGYIFPLYSPSGLNVADDYQVDHPHMHGLWSAWTSTTFQGHAVDFWNGYANSGRVDLESMDGAWSGTVHAGLGANLLHTDITDTMRPPVPALKEKWIVTVYRTHEGTAPYFVFDIESTQETAGADPLVLETFHYGGFGFRGSEEWQDPARMSFLTSEGHDRATGDGQRGRWVAQWGSVGNSVAGYAAFDHPTNFRHPQGLRIHPTNPYWSFTASTMSAGGRFSIEQGTPYHSLYRVVSFDGAADAQLLERLWADFATPPTVQVLPP